MEKILVVDDEKSLREILSILLKNSGYNVITARDCKEAINLLDKEIFDLVITDIRMPNGSGMDVLKVVRDISDDTVVIMMTAHGTMENAVEAMKLGAYDYIMKPFKVEEVKHIIKNALEKKQLQEENHLLRKELKELGSVGSIIGRSQAFNQLMEVIDQVAPSISSVLITGETGTGKELAARALHFKSSRLDKPFVTINCGAIPETLLESELFGHMKGSFTGAIANKEGLFEVADKGTIFLDEIGEMPMTIQVKLLRVLQEKEIRRLGGVANIKVDARVIAATNKNLVKEIEENRFREDLYYRLAVIPIELPPLRERVDDIPLLVNHFVKKYTNKSGMEMKKISEGALKLLMTKDWPGNIRELENTIERVVAFSRKKMITSQDITNCNSRQHRRTLSGNISEVPEGGMDLENVIGSIEKKLLNSALRKSGWKKKKAADLLGLNFRSFRYRLEKYNIKKFDEVDKTDDD